jgi:hypothetical protein
LVWFVGEKFDGLFAGKYGCLWRSFHPTAASFEKGLALTNHFPNFITAPFTMANTRSVFLGDTLYMPENALNAGSTA